MPQIRKVKSGFHLSSRSFVTHTALNAAEELQLVRVLVALLKDSAYLELYEVQAAALNL